MSADTVLMKRTQ